MKPAFIPRDRELFFELFIYFITAAPEHDCERKRVNECFECGISMTFEIKDIRLKSTLERGAKERML